PHRLRVVAGGQDRLGQQRQRANRSLELVADVGDEVPAHRVDPVCFSAVLYEDQDELRAERGDPDGDGQRVAAERSARDLKFELPDLSIPAHLPGHRDQFLGDQPLTAHQSEGVRRRGCLDHGVAGIEQHRGGSQDLEHRGHAGRHQRLGGGRLGRAPLALAPAERETARGADGQRYQGGRRSRGDVEIGREVVHTPRVNARADHSARPEAHSVIRRQEFTFTSRRVHRRARLRLRSPHYGEGSPRCAHRRAGHGRAKPPPQLTGAFSMRDVYHEELDSIGRTLIEMTGLVGAAMGRATAAPLEADLQVAESVISADDAVDALQSELDSRALDLLARQQPVAGDLRTIITSLRMSADLERMGDLARHIAKVARLRYPEIAVPEELRPMIQEMGRIAGELAQKTAEIIDGRDVDAARELPEDDDEMDELHRALFRALLDKKTDYSVETAIDVTLIGRYYERFADHSVSVARRLIFLVTGEHH